MARHLQELGYRKDQPMHVNRASILQAVRENEEILGFNPGNHRFNLIYERSPDPRTLAEYVPSGKRFKCPQICSRAAMSHEAVHYLMHRRGKLLSLDDHGLYGRLIDEIIATIVPMSAYDFDHEFRLETYTEEDVRRHNEGMFDVEDQVAGLALAKKHREIEMKVPPGNFDPLSVMEDIALFLHGSWDMPARQTNSAGYYLANDLASRLLRIGLTPRDFYNLLDAGVCDGTRTADIYFQIIGIAKELDPLFFG